MPLAFIQDIRRLTQRREDTRERLWTPSRWWFERMTGVAALHNEYANSSESQIRRIAGDAQQRESRAWAQPRLDDAVVELGAQAMTAHHQRLGIIVCAELHVGLRICRYGGRARKLNHAIGRATCICRGTSSIGHCSRGWRARNWHDVHGPGVQPDTGEDPMNLGTVICARVRGHQSRPYPLPPRRGLAFGIMAATSCMLEADDGR